MLLRSIVQPAPLARRCSSVARCSAATTIGLESDGFTPDVYAIDGAPAAAAASIAALWPATRVPIRSVLMTRTFVAPAKASGSVPGSSSCDADAGAAPREVGEPGRVAGHEDDLRWVDLGEHALGDQAPEVPGGARDDDAHPALQPARAASRSPATSATSS